VKYLKLLAVSLVVLAILIPFGCKKKEVVASGKGIEVTKDKVDSLLKKYLKQSGIPANLPAAQKKQIEKQIRNQVVDSLVREQVMEIGAKKEGISVSDAEIDKKINEIKKQFPKAGQLEDLLKKQGQTIDDLKSNLKTQLLGERLRSKLTKGKIKITDKEIQDYYNKNKFQFKDQDKVKAQHILLKTKEKAEEVLAKVKAGEDFAKLAKQFSTDPGSKESGGDLGYFDKNQMVPEFSKVAFSLKVGEISGVVKSQFGYHIIKVQDKKSAKDKSFAEVKSQIKTMIKQQKETEIINKWIEEQKKELGVKKVG
jgi:foldase protein PrsA